MLTEESNVEDRVDTQGSLKSSRCQNCEMGYGREFHEQQWPGKLWNRGVCSRMLSVTSSSSSKNTFNMWRSPLGLVHTLWCQLAGRTACVSSSACSLCRRALFLVLLLVSFGALSVTAQYCSPLTDCHPPPKSLLFQADPLDVSSTCSGSYRASSRGIDTTNYTCVAADHDKTLMIDGAADVLILNFTYENPELLTYWQSSNTISFVGQWPNLVVPQWISASFGSPFLVRFIRIIFLSPHLLDAPTSNSDMRPTAMMIEKQAAAGGTWIPMRYYAKSCPDYYPNVVQQLLGPGEPDQPGNLAFCIQQYYGGDASTYTNWGGGFQEFLFRPARDYGDEFDSSQLLQDFYRAAAIRFNLKLPADQKPLSSYYAVADLDITGQCSCYGHAAQCDGLNGAGCLCQHNTQGENCQLCMPLFNNKTWMIGSKNSANACEDCGCVNNHATSCTFDANKGYGVCNDCLFNSAGDKCDDCSEFYYINPLKDFYNATNPAPVDCNGYVGTTPITYDCGRWCIPCDCNQLGTDPNSRYTCDSVTGICTCKIRVTGRACDQCVDGAWDLQATDPFGCKACTCSPLGTLNNNLCNKTTGACLCKNNTEGADCSQCKAGYFGFSGFNPEGCTACDCDIGASTSLTCPSDVTGQCTCRNRIAGRTCRGPHLGYYGPALDELTYQAEFTVSATTYPVVERVGQGQAGNDGCVGLGFLQVSSGAAVKFSVQVPRTQNYYVILRYQSTVALWPGVQVSLMMQNPPASQYQCGLLVKQMTVPVVTTGTLPIAVTSGYVKTGPACLYGNAAYIATVSIPASNPADQSMLLDSLVLIPATSDLTVFTGSPPATQLQITQCVAVAESCDLTAQANLGCPAVGYSVMTQLYDGATVCGCNPMGSGNLNCDPIGGQCACKTNVMLRDCSQCKVNTYGFSSGVGCTACACDPQGSVLLKCHDGGICDCKVNVTGIKCDSCLQDHWGLFTGNGCQPCACNPDYSLNNGCEDSAQCLCKPGIGGIACTECQAGFYNLQLDNCTSCGCHEDGSGMGMCDKVSGACSCKLQATGPKCDQCVPGYFGLGQWSADGCIGCFCSGHSTNCSTADGWYQAVVADTWDLLRGSSATAERWTGVDNMGAYIVVTDPTIFTATAAEHVMRINNTDEYLNRTALYFVATEAYLGRMQGAYGQNISFSLSAALPPPEPNVTQDLTPIISANGDIILGSLYTSFSLVASLWMTPNETVTEYVFPLQESSWRVNTVTGVQPTYTQMIQVLANLGSIYVRGKYNNVNGSVVNLHSASLYYAAPAIASNLPTMPINNIEQCFCSAEYTGQFCESCAPGYTRLNADGGPYTACVPCDCNGHAAGVVPCDPVTGVCNCTHNTLGDHCGICMDGYAGDATVAMAGDCQPCMCPGDVIAGAVNAFASTCQRMPLGTQQCINCTGGHTGDQCDVCQPNWYGQPANITYNFGQCQECVCNGLADTCDGTTGVCTACRNNSAGKECEICAPGFFGNSLTNTCKPCTCTSLGSTGECDHQTGGCICKPYVISSGLSTMPCDRCVANSYNYTSGLGCTPCGCDTTGSVGQGCNSVTGQCLCGQNVTGRACNICDDTFWDVTLAGCQACQCRPEGTINIPGETFGTCEVVTGQCTCAKDGIIGRDCSYCAQGTKSNFIYSEPPPMEGAYPDCRLCGECYDNWAATLDQIGMDIRGLFDLSMVIWSHYDSRKVTEVAPQLTKISMDLESVQSTIVLATSLVEKLDYLAAGFTDVLADAAFKNELLDNTTSTSASIQALLDKNKEFGTGLVEVAPGVWMTPDTLLARTAELQQSLLERYANANSTWSSIETLDSMIRRSGGDVQVLTAAVTAAVAKLTVAENLRLQVVALLNSTVQPQYDDTVLRFAGLNAAITEFGIEIQQIAANVAQTTSVTAEAESTVTTADVLIQAAKADMTAMMVLAEQAKFNASQAQASSQMAQSSVSTYRTLANNTRNEILQSLESVNDGISALDYVDGQVASANQMAADVTLITLRPLQSMQTITQQISTTQVSQESVDKVQAAAQQGQQASAEALSISQTAVVEANLTRDVVTSIQSNLQQANLLRQQTVTGLNNLTNINTSVSTIITQATAKAGNAMNLGRQTGVTINNLQAYIQTVSQCLVTQNNQVELLQIRLRQANSTAEAAGTAHLVSVAKLVTVVGPLAGKQVQLQGNLQQLTQIEDGVNTLKSGLAAVNSIANVALLAAQVNTQRVEMNAIVQDLDVLEQELNTLITGLGTFDPASAQCTLNKR